MKLGLLAGTHSGCGKTTLMLTLLQYLKARQHSVVSFKSGPDFLDPLWHQVVTGRQSYNVDTRMIGVQHSAQLIAQQAAVADCGLIEGVMGLFDGRSGVGGSGSSAELAQALQVPVFLVVDAGGMSGSIVAMVSGYVTYAQKMGVTIAGIIANRVGSKHHAGLLSEALSDYQQPPLVAWMEKSAPVLPERHLGLVQPSEVQLPDFLPFLHIEVDNFVDFLTETLFVPPEPVKQQGLLKNKKIAVAKDAACCFIYPANLDFLREQSAEILFFSPLAGEAIPYCADTLWLPGGYPELFAQALSVSNTWLSLRDFIEADKPVLAECGGAMLLGESLIDLDGRSWSMANILPFRSKMQTKLASLGYREEAAGVKGHEFHHSVRKAEQSLEPCFQVERGDTGVRYKNLRASYVHWYFASAPEVITKWLGGSQ
ncbi:cobalamin biosynthesis protein CobB [Methyloprofundus sedimenti]|uniref:Cobalamin biosynthesis protein CobB n=1 Tax=Methyloprofundus sedimenti TaxID=1420851 RepID=A0A1V8M0R3_9GAMM|nr:cobyrinate a,c-diamide synthase [Methyloprofundus sedimenti]OQK15160.1 cobalamin biosynthesis protein CobB [Methyloprofundus sedimenti]